MVETLAVSPEWIVDTEYIKTPSGTYKGRIVSWPKIGEEGRWFAPYNDLDRALSQTFSTRESALAAIERAWGIR